MKRGPKLGKTRPALPAGTAPTGLGECPPELVGLGRQLWVDAVAHLAATSRSQTVHRTALLVTCRLVEGLADDAGLNRIDAIRRWLHELGLTPTTSGRGAAEAPTHDAGQTGRARILSLIDRKTASQ